MRRSYDWREVDTCPRMFRTYKREHPAKFACGSSIAFVSLLDALDVLSLRNTDTPLNVSHYLTAMVTSTRQIWERAPTEEWLWVLLVAIFSLYLLYYLKDHLRILKLILSLGGPPAIPLLGNASWVYKENMLHMASHTAYKDWGPIFRVWLTLLPCVVLLEPKDIQLVLGSSKHTGKIVFYKMLDNFLGKGLITRSVESWTTHRRIIQPGFHLQFLEKFTESFARCSDRLVEKLVSLGGQQVDITSFVNDSVYEILNETVLGLKLHEGESSTADELPFRKGKVLVPYRLIRPWLLIDWIYKMTSTGRNEQKQRDDLANACYRMISQKRERRAHGEHPAHRKSLLDFMLQLSEKNPSFTDEEIVNECCTFMLAGQDSVGTATAMTLFLLANNPEWMDKCVAEIDEIFENRGEEAAPIMEDFRAMKSLDMCIKETLRLYPSVPLFARTLGEDVTIGKHVIPAGCGIMIVPYSTHRLPHHFPDPHNFKPERFSPENSANRHPYSYIPFSAGPRNCIGYKFAMLEIKSMISAVLRKCVLHPVSGKEEVRPKFRLTVRAKGGLWVGIAPRRNEIDKNSMTTSK